MSISRAKLLKEMKRQEEIEGPSEDIELLKKFLEIIHTAMQWSVFTKVKSHRYGKLSYECHHFHYPTDDLKALMKGTF